MANTAYLNYDWRWYEDDAAEPVAALASENVSATPAAVENYRLRYSAMQLPDSTGLWAWYRCDEGTGTTVANTTTGSTIEPLPHLTITNGAPAWHDSPVCLKTIGNLMASATYSRTETGCSPWGIFVYLSGAWPTNYTQRGIFEVANTAGAGNVGNYLNCGLYAPTKVIGYSGKNGIAGSTYSYLTDLQTQNKWVFVYMTNSFEPDHGEGIYGYTQIHVVTNDGVKYDDAGDILSYGSGEWYIDWVYLGAYWSQVWGFLRWKGYIGDLVIFDPDTEITSDDWGVWYDALRDRYGMAARSGW